MTASKAPVIERTDFRSEIKRLNKGIRIAWFMDFMILTMTIEAAMIVIFLSGNSSNEQLESFLTITIIISAIISAIITHIVSKKSGEILMASAKGNMRQVNNGIVYNVVKEMAIAANIEMPEVWIAVNSPVVNAYAVSDKNKSRIIITDKLLRIMTREELQGVVGHEIGHIASGDSKAMTTLTTLTSVVGTIMGIAMRLAVSFNNSDDDDDDNDKGGLNIIAIIIIILSFIFLLISPLLAKIAESYMSRTREATADMLSVKYTRNPTSLANALYKLSLGEQAMDKNSTKQFIKSPAGNVAFYMPAITVLTLATHPPLKERINKLIACGAHVNTSINGLTVIQRMNGENPNNNQNTILTPPLNALNQQQSPSSVMPARYQMPAVPQQSQQHNHPQHYRNHQPAMNSPVQSPSQRLQPYQTNARLQPYNQPNMLNQQSKHMQ
jgi:heat shock protein HtpX